MKFFRLRPLPLISFLILRICLKKVLPHTASSRGTYNRFSGKTVKLDTNIEVTSMAGSAHHDFCGTFDGNKKTLTVSYGSASNPINEDNVAPFSFVENGCVIKDLHVAGNIYTSKQFAGGLAGTQYGTVKIENCHISTVIHSYTSGDGTHGGIVGHAGNSSSTKLTIDGCVFDGKLFTISSRKETPPLKSSSDEAAINDFGLRADDYRHHGADAERTARQRHLCLHG